MPLAPHFVPYVTPGAYGIGTELWSADSVGNLIAQIDPELLGPADVTYSDDTAPRRRMTMAVREPHRFRALHEWIVPIIRISDPEGNALNTSLGHFLVTPASSSAGPDGIDGQVRAQDKTTWLILATRDDLFIAAGTDPGDWVRNLAYEVGFPPAQVKLPITGFAWPADKRWDPGTSIYHAMGEVMNTANWYQPWTDLEGVLTSGPLRPLTSIPTTYTYTNATEADAEVLEGMITEDPDWSQLANVVTVRRIGFGETPTISYTARNQNPISDISIPALGYEIGVSIDDPEITTIEQAKDRAEYNLSLRSSHYRKLNMQTFPEILADAHQTIGLEIFHGPMHTYADAWWRPTFTHHLDGSRSHTAHTLARVEDWRG